MLKYAGIGHRSAPKSVLAKIEQRATALALAGYHVRTGDAQGPCAWFAHHGRPNATVITPFEASFHLDWFDAAKMGDPSFDKQQQFYQRLMAMNAGIILGSNLDDPVDFVLIAWSGGMTNHATRLARHHGIPVHHLT